MVDSSSSRARFVFCNAVQSGCEKHDGHRLLDWEVPGRAPARGTEVCLDAWRKARGTLDEAKERPRCRRFFTSPRDGEERDCWLKNMKKSGSDQGFSGKRVSMDSVKKAESL